MSRPEHQQIQELLGAYALDAVDATERRQVEDHLRTCDTCPLEVEGHRAAMAALVPEDAPPAGVWERISSTLEEAPPRLRLVPEQPSARRPLLRTAELVVAAAVVALAFKVVDQDRQIDRLTNSLRKQAVASTAYERLTDPSTKSLALGSESGTQAQLVLAEDGRGVLISGDLPHLKENETYQLWALVGDSKISSGLLGPQPNVSLFTFKGKPDGFAVTKEPSGGSPQPTADPLLIGLFR